ncbi:MAG: hypothetical protein IJ213_03505 [Bacteroidales bacterium]|nr:hypothetical protein [Bacteroidales bacterium]
MKIICKILKSFLFLLAIVSLFYACEKAPQMPKPSTYMRIDIKPSEYVKLQKEDLPFSFSIPKDGKIVEIQSREKNMTWFNISFDDYNFDINVSCLKLTNDTMLQYAVNDCYTFLSRHEKLSGGIIQQEYKNDEKHIYGTTFEIQGRDVVSPYQFYLTDSAKYFVRFALNNRQLPNNDSIAPIVARLKTDMQTMINTFEWKK